MREIDVSHCELIHAGKEWDYDKDPCAKDMIKLLERKESYCFWFQPLGKGVECQFPVLAVKGRFYQLSLRIQKAIFRHIRLHEEFSNIETIPDGRQKLRIPSTLLEEKRRTSSRFNVCLTCAALLLCVTCAPLHYVFPTMCSQLCVPNYVFPTMLA
jgi:hypothetical protein